MTTIFATGKPVPNGMCVMPDNSVSEFNVKVRSLLPVHADRLKSIIERYYEVVSIEKTDETTVVRNAYHGS